MARNAFIRFRRATAAAWTSTDPVLAAGEPGFETDTGKVKVGDGSSAWSSLPYLGAGSSVTFGTPAVSLGLSAAAGSVDEVIRRDSTIVAFDTTVPSTQAFGDSAAAGSAAVAARRDHKHAMPATPTSVSGNAGTATALQTGRTIDGQTFDGTANITVIAPGTHAATGKTTPVDADEMPLTDSAASFVLKKLTWANLKATLKTYFDTLYSPVGGGGPPTGSAGGTLGGTYPNPTVNTDGSTIETNSNALRVKAAGIGATQLANTAVTPASYGDATHAGQFTVDQQGRITAAASVAISGAGGAGADGWVDDSAHTWTYASASTFTISGVDLTAVFTPGTRLKFTQTTVKYGVVASSSFSTNTTVTIIVNTDYVLANAAISVNSYSYALNPQGYPGWFLWTPSPTGFSGTPSVNANRFCVNGRLVTVQIEITGTSNATGFTWTLPVTVNAPGTFESVMLIQNAGTFAFGMVLLAGGGTTATMYRDASTSTWTNSGTKTCYGVAHYAL